MYIKNTIVNANENDIFLGQAYHRTCPKGKSRSYRLKYRDQVNSLIKKYWNSPYKALPKSRQYTFVELSLVTEFDIAEIFYEKRSGAEWKEMRQSFLDMIAYSLEISPVVLLNDNDLPTYLIP